MNTTLNATMIDCAKLNTTACWDTLHQLNDQRMSMLGQAADSLKGLVGTNENTLWWVDTGVRATASLAGAACVYHAVTNAGLFGKVVSVATAALLFSSAAHMPSLR